MGFQIFVFLEKVKVWLLFISPSALEVSFPFGFSMNLPCCLYTDAIH